MGERISIDLDARLGVKPSRQISESINRVMQVFDGELLHRWESGQIREEDRLLDFLVFYSGLSVEPDTDVDVEPTDLGESSPAELGYTIQSTIGVLLASSGLVEATAVIEGRRGFCKAFDELAFDVRKKAVRFAHSTERGKPKTPRGIERGFPIVESDTQHPGNYIAYRYGQDGLVGYGNSDLQALDDLERREHRPETDRSRHSLDSRD